MSMQRRISSALGSIGAFVALTGAVCSAQSVISARSGTLHYFDGDVSIDGVPVQAQVSKFAQIKDQSVLSTALGRGEVLLTPGVFLRLGENTSIKMLDNRLASTRVDILSGTVILESDDPQMSVKDSPVVLLYKDYEIRMQKHGLAELGSDPAQLKVFKGEALVETAAGTGNNNRAEVREGHLLSFSAALVTEKFDDKTGDELYLWARDRSQSLSAANMSSARSLGSGFTSSDGSGSGFGGWNGGWYYNPYFDMYTYVPLAGTLWNPWGYGFFSPGTISNYYAPTSYWYGSGGPAGASATGRPFFGSNGTLTAKPAPIGSLLGGGAAGRGPGALGGSTTSSMSSGSVSGFSAASRGGSVGGFGGGHASGGHAGGGHR